MDILNNFIDEWFENPSINLDDLELPIGISVSFHNAIATELALAQKIVELRTRLIMRKLSSRGTWQTSVWLMFKASSRRCMSSRSSFTRNARKQKVQERE